MYNNARKAAAVPFYSHTVMLNMWVCFDSNDKLCFWAFPAGAQKLAASQPATVSSASAWLTSNSAVGGAAALTQVEAFQRYAGVQCSLSSATVVV